MGDFLKKVPHTPQKLSENFYCVMRSLSFLRNATFPAIGPQLPNAGRFVFLNQPHNTKPAEGESSSFGVSFPRSNAPDGAQKAA